MSSESVHNPYPFLSTYAAAKAGLEVLSEGVRRGLMEDVIRVSIFRSGRIQGGFSNGWGANMKVRARAAAEHAGFYSRAGEAVPLEVPVRAIIDLVCLERSARVELMELRGNTALNNG